MGTTDPAESDKPPSPGPEGPGIDPGDHRQRVTAVVLAAGRGTRMRSDTPKGLHALAGRPVLLHVLHALRDGGLRRAIVVTGHGAEQVEAAIGAAAPAGLDVLFVRQPAPLGTGHAALQALALAPSGEVLVVNGDLPLLRPQDVCAVLAAPPSCLTLAAARVPDPSGLGRVRRDGGRLQAVVEEADADAATRAIDEVNVGLYRADAAWLWRTLASLPASASGEVYLTGAVARAAASGDAGAVVIDAPDGPLNVESQRDLARAGRALRARINDGWMDAGVTIVDPATTYIDAGVLVGEGSRLEPGTHLRGATALGRRNVVGPNSVLIDTRTGDGCALVQCRSEGAVLGDDVDVGAFSTLREGTVLDGQVHIGTHAETKNAHLHRGVQMGHFSYLGDAEVGAGSNIGAGAITCNFDGTRKHRTTIGADCFVGSGTLLIAPVTMGDGAATAAGAVVRKDVPAGRLAAGSAGRMRRRKRDET